MNTSRNSTELNKSKFKDSKVDIKDVFSEKTDLESKADDLSTFSKHRFIFEIFDQMI